MFFRFGILSQNSILLTLSGLLWFGLTSHDSQLADSSFSVTPLLELQVFVYYSTSHVSSFSSSISLRGDNLGLNWNKGVMMTEVIPGSGIWNKTLFIKSTDQEKSLEMKPLLEDKIWMTGHNVIVVLPKVSSRVNIYPWFGDQNGRIELITNVSSKKLENTRSLGIYVPPSYYENTKRQIQHVLIMQDGNNLYTSDLCNTCCPFGCWSIHDTLNSLIKQGAIDEVLVVGVFNTPERISEYTYSKDPKYGGGNADVYLDFLQEIVLPLVRNRYRIVKSFGPDNLSIMGSSLGGLLSCYAGYTRPAVYGNAGCMSSSFWWNGQDFDKAILPSRSEAPKNLLLYLDSGDQGSGQDDKDETIQATQHLRQLGKTLNSDLFYYLDHGASHSEAYWGPRFWRPVSHFYPIKPLPTIPLVPLKVL